MSTALFVGCGTAPAEDTGAVVGSAGSGPAAPVASGAGRGAGGAPGAAVPGIMMSSVPCGTATCTGIMFAGMGAAACCADATTNACGTMQAGACMPKPPVAELCPKIAPILGMQVNSCCQANGTCGVDGSAFGRGCGAYSGLRMIPGAMVPPETSCDGTPLAPAAAGTGAAGSSAAGSSAAGSSAAGTSAAGSSAAGSSAAGTSGAAGARAGSGGAPAGGTTGGAAGARAGAGGAAGR